MKVSIINIGDELLIGQVVNTNATWMSQQLIAAGMDVSKVYTISDNRKDIENTLQQAMLCSDAVIITGGLGPTKDDITKKTLCDFFNSDFVEDKATFDIISSIFEKRGYPMTDTNRQQALVPRCCTVLLNKRGTAPGMWFEKDGKVIVSLPGVPFEMKYLIDEEVIPRLVKYFDVGCILNKNILFQGIGESFLSDRIEQWELSLPQYIRLAYLPKAGLVRLRLTARGNDRDKKEMLDGINRAVVSLYEIVGNYIVGEDMETLAEVIADKMIRNAKTLSVAESCSGGAIASSITSLSGASQYFKGGVVAYSNEIKERMLGVNADTLSKYGAVSEETAREMAEGGAKAAKADACLSVTGIAGPDGGTAEKPVGLVYIGCHVNGNTIVERNIFSGTRREVREQSVLAALKLLKKQLQ